MTKIILLNGPPRSGKDTLANSLDRAGILSFAAPIHTLWGNVLYDYFDNYNEFQKYTMGDKKQERLDLLDMSYREACIDFAENYMKPRFGDDIFAKIVSNSIDKEFTVYKAPYVVVSDLGFREEAIPLIERYGAENILVIQLSRAGYNFRDDSRTYVDLRELNVKTVTLENITVDQLIRDGRKLIDDFVSRAA